MQQPACDAQCSAVGLAPAGGWRGQADHPGAVADPDWSVAAGCCGVARREFVLRRGGIPYGWPLAAGTCLAIRGGAAGRFEAGVGPVPEKNPQRGVCGFLRIHEVHEKEEPAGAAGQVSHDTVVYSKNTLMEGDREFSPELTCSGFAEGSRRVVSHAAQAPGRAFPGLRSSGFLSGPRGRAALDDARTGRRLRYIVATRLLARCVSPGFAPRTGRARRMSSSMAMNPLAVRRGGHPERPRAPYGKRVDHHG